MAQQKLFLELMVELRQLSWEIDHQEGPSEKKTMLNSKNKYISPKNIWPIDIQLIYMIQ